jgi:hypothetical protein
VAQPARPGRTRPVRKRNRQRVAAAFFAVGALLTVAACGSDSEESKPSATKSTSSPSIEAKEAAARKAALQALSGMREEQAKAYAVGSASKTKLTDYAADKALAAIEGELFKYRQAGVVFRGKPNSSAEVTAIDLSGTPNKATIKECFDTAPWKAVLKKSGKDVTTPNQVRKYTVTGVARTFGDDWKIVELNVDKGRPC